jgi:hypothetical protein
VTELTDPEFDQLFTTFEHTAFRLEVRDRYDAPYSADSVREFLAGEADQPDDRAWFKPWVDFIRQVKAAGKRFERVRVVTVPLSDYSRYSLWSSQTNNKAGEDIRYLARDQAEGLPDHDYWLFDSRTLAWMHFDDDDRFVGAEIIDEPAEIVRHNYWRDLAWHRAIRREDFAA